MTSIPGLSADLAIGSFTIAAVGGAQQPTYLMEKTVRWPA
jgi:hypothetical protein